MKIDEFLIELKKINIELTNKQLQQLQQYYELLIEWNQKINLTAITIKEDVYLKHFYDSLTISKVIDLNKIDSLCDIGTGAGFPGIVLKIVFPKLNVTLVDALNKRIIFLNEVIKNLNLEKIETVHLRAEDFSKKNREKYDVVTARAVSKLNILLEICIPAVKIKGYFIPLKGNINEELLNCTNALNLLNLEIIEKEEFILPKENSKRTILKIIKQQKTSEKYPRTYSEIKKKSL